MKRNINSGTFFIIGVVGLFIISCSSTKPNSATSDSSNKTSSAKTVNTAEGNNGLTLANYLRRIPGVLVDQRGSDVSVMIRSASSVGSNNQPLFVVNNSAVGNPPR